MRSGFLARIDGNNDVFVMLINLTEASSKFQADKGLGLSDTNTKE